MTTVSNGRFVRAAFIAGALSLLVLGNEDLFSAVALSGTAWMLLAPVLLGGCGAVSVGAVPAVARRGRTMS